MRSKGAHPDMQYLSMLIKSIYEKDFTREICLILYYYIDHITDFKKITESKIRKIKETLEYMYEMDCGIHESNSLSNYLNILYN